MMKNLIKGLLLVTMMSFTTATVANAQCQKDCKQKTEKCDKKACDKKGCEKKQGGKGQCKGQCKK